MTDRVAIDAELDVVLAFPRSCCQVRVDRVCVVVPRERLIELENFCAALRLGLVEEETPPAGCG